MATGFLDEMRQVPDHRVQVGPNHTHPQDDSHTWQPTAELTLGL